MLIKGNIIFKQLQQSLKQQGFERAWTALNGQPPPTNMLVMEEDDQDMEDSLIKTPFDLGKLLYKLLNLCLKIVIFLIL